MSAALALLTAAGTGAPKDPDAIKLFVGSIPRHMNETDIRPHFEPYGEISEMVVLRDRHTGASKGCGFVFYRTRQSALDAMSALNEKLALPGVRFSDVMRVGLSVSRAPRPSRCAPPTPRVRRARSASSSLAC